MYDNHTETFERIHDKEIIEEAAVGSDYDTKELERIFGKTRFQKALCGNHDSGIFPHVRDKKIILEVPI